MADNLILDLPYLYCKDGDAYLLVGRGVYGGCALQDADGTRFYVPASCVKDHLAADSIWAKKISK
jgi:hypothetical protein